MNKFNWNLNCHINTFFQENMFENVVSKTVSIGLSLNVLMGESHNQLH